MKNYYNYIKHIYFQKNKIFNLICVSYILFFRLFFTSIFYLNFAYLFIQTEVSKQCIPTKLGWLRQKVISVSMGAMHTAILVEPGKLITFGCNKSGQLGRGNIRNSSSPAVVKSMGDRTVTV